MLVEVGGLAEHESVGLGLWGLFGGLGLAGLLFVAEVGVGLDLFYRVGLSFVYCGEWILVYWLSDPVYMLAFLFLGVLHEEEVRDCLTGGGLRLH